MLNEGKGISETIKEDINKIWDLFLNDSYSTHSFNFGNDKIGYKVLIIKFNYINNYYSNISIDKLNNIVINIGIPTNGKEKRVKENISHELTHVIELLGLNGKDYPRYNKIKTSLREFKNYPMSEAMIFITDVFYKTLDNEINANIAQTYIYVKSDGKCSKEDALKRLKEWETYKLYDNIKNIKLEILSSNLKQKEIDDFNDILLKNDVKTISSNNMKIWLNYWFKFFKRKSVIFIKNSERILDEIGKDWKMFENYIDNEYDGSKKYFIYPISLTLTTLKIKKF
jgi:hypothetical protein